MYLHMKSKTISVSVTRVTFHLNTRSGLHRSVSWLHLHWPGWAAHSSAVGTVTSQVFDLTMDVFLLYRRHMDCACSQTLTWVKRTVLLLLNG